MEVLSEPEKLIGGQLLRYDVAKSMDRRLEALGVPKPTQQSIYNKINSALSKAKAFCESPIEIMCLEGLLCADFQGFYTCPVPVHIPKKEEKFPSGDLVIIPQFAIARYRLDFALIAKDGDRRIIAAVECDGEEFHNSTSSVYQADRNRDDYIENLGIKTFRIKGTALYKNQFSAVYPVVNFLSDWKLSNG